LRLASTLLRLYQRSGLQALARRSGLLSLLGLKRLEARLPKLNEPGRWREYYPPTGTRRADVALFTGCISDAFDAATAHAAITVLNALGYGVRVPAAQRCCGALHLHNGEPEQALRFAEANVAAFDAGAVEAIITTASGCGATLAEYDQRLPGADRFARKVVDISAFLAGVDWPESIRLMPLPRRVAIHDPCSLTHVLRQPDKPHTLLRRIPGIELVALPDAGRCCGAAGSYMVTHPGNADRLRDAKLDALDGLNVETLATSNIGCALHLAAGLRARGTPIEVIHPITLIARQLETTSCAAT
jgi:glycolate oxidase iron-sulfur subunit